MRCLLDCGEGQSLSKEEIERNVNDNYIVEFVVVRSRSNSEYLNISMQNLIKVSKCEELHFVRKLKLARNRKIRRVI